jgi:hypothetical protein
VFPGNGWGRAIGVHTRYLFRHDSDSESRLILVRKRSALKQALQQLSARCTRLRIATWKVMATASATATVTATAIAALRLHPLQPCANLPCLNCLCRSEPAYVFYLSCFEQVVRLRFASSVINTSHKASWCAHHVIAYLCLSYL